MKYFSVVVTCLAIIAGLGSVAKADDVEELGYARVCFVRHAAAEMDNMLLGWAHAGSRKVPLSGG